MVDLEQFREAVKCWRRSAAACGSSDDVKEADRLLSIIDNAGGAERRDREADRARFTDPDFNDWLDCGISDCGHTVYDSIDSIADAWQGWNAHVVAAIRQQPAAVPDDAARLLAICQNAHDRLLRGDDDNELLAILEQAWMAREAVGVGNG